MADLSSMLLDPRPFANISKAENGYILNQAHGRQLVFTDFQTMVDELKRIFEL